MDSKQKSIAKGVIRVFINTSTIKSPLIGDSGDIKYDELMSILQYVNDDHFFK